MSKKSFDELRADLAKRPLFREPERDLLTELLPKFIDAKGVEIPTVNLDTEEQDELRRLLVEWDTGNPVEGVIIEKYALDDEPGIFS